MRPFIIRTRTPPASAVVCLSHDAFPSVCLSCPGHGSSGSGETSSSPPLPTSLPYGVLQGVLDANPVRLPTLEEVRAKTDAALASLSGATARQPSAALGSLPLNAPPSAGAGPSSAYPCVYPFASLPATLQLPTLPSAFAGTLNASPAGVAGSSSASDALLPSALAGMLPLNTAPTAAAASSSASASVPAGAASPAASAPAAGAGVTRLTPQERIQAEVMLTLAQSAKDEEGMPPPRQ